MIEFIERFEVFTTSVTKAYKCIQKIKLIETGNHSENDFNPLFITESHSLTGTLEGVNAKIFRKLLYLEKWQVMALMNPRKKNRGLRRRMRKAKGLWERKEKQRRT